jgi:hypothetical protein
MKQTLKIIISPTKPKGIFYKLRPKKNVPPTFLCGEGGVGRGLRTTIKEGIAIMNLTQKNPRILST